MPDLHTLAGLRHAALATLLDGHPYASLVAVASHAEKPVFLLSELAEHTRNLRRDARASLLVVDDWTTEDPLARARATLVGRCVEGAAERAREAYLAVHPAAASYLAMADFHFWTLEVEAVRSIAGFGVMGWTRTRTHP